MGSFHLYGCDAVDSFKLLLKVSSVGIGEGIKIL